MNVEAEEFLKENKKVRKQENKNSSKKAIRKQENEKENKNSTKKAIKKTRKQELGQEKKNFLFS